MIVHGSVVDVGAEEYNLSAALLLIYHFFIKNDFLFNLTPPEVKFLQVGDNNLDIRYLKDKKGAGGSSL